MEVFSAATITQVLQLGFAAVVAWYLLTKAIPRSEERADRRDAQFVAAIEKRDIANALMLEKQHADHNAEISRLVDHHVKQTDRILDAVAELECAPNGGGRDRNSR